MAPGANKTTNGKQGHTSTNRGAAIEARNCQERKKILETQEEEEKKKRKEEEARWKHTRGVPAITARESGAETARIPLCTRMHKAWVGTGKPPHPPLLPFAAGKKIKESRSPRTSPSHRRPLSMARA